MIRTVERRDFLGKFFSEILVTVCSGVKPISNLTITEF